MEIYKGDALTVGQLRKAIEGLADDVELGHAILGITGHVNKVTSLHVSREHGILVFDSHKRVGAFSEDEFSKEDLEEIARL